MATREQTRQDHVRGERSRRRCASARFNVRAHTAAYRARSDDDHSNRETNCAIDTAPPSVKSSKNPGTAFASSLAIIEGQTESMPGFVRGATRAGEHAGDTELARDVTGEAERGAAAAAGRAGCIAEAAGTAEREQIATAGLRVRTARRATRPK